jgi:uncharacterized protein YjaZ
MKSKIIIVASIIVAALMMAVFVLPEKNTPPTNGTNYNFVDGESVAFTDEQRARIKDITKATIEKTKQFYPTLSENINFNILIIDRDLSALSGTTGRADRVHEIEVSFSSSYPGGLDQAIEDGLAATLFHELHHTMRGWLIYDNKFGRGIDIAAINEGLADIFAEIQVGHPDGTYTDEPDFDAWTQEILALPKNANYGEWMFQLPDGRVAVGYRTGAWLVRKAMTNSGKNILEMSELPVSDIYRLAGYSHGSGQ